MQKTAEFTVQYVPLPPERVAAWRAAMRVWVEICIADQKRLEGLKEENNESTTHLKSI